MNEPAVFHKPTMTMPEDNRHQGYGGGPHAQYLLFPSLLPSSSFPLSSSPLLLRFHNVYGMLMIKATKEGIKRVRPNKRPFVLSRANFLGGQR